MSFNEPRLVTKEEEKEKAVKLVIGLDLGGSGTRAVVKGKDKIYKFESALKLVDKEEYIPEEVKMNDFKAIIHDDTVSYILKNKGVNYSSSPIRNQKNDSMKSKDILNKLNCLDAIDNIMRDLKVSNAEVSIVVALPPNEVYTQEVNVFKEEFKGYYEVCTRDGATTRFKITFVGAVAEGLTAVYSLSEEDLDELYGDHIMIIDGGYRSTDIIIAKELEPVEAGFDSFPIGGISLESKVAYAFKSKMDPQNKDGITSAISEGIANRTKAGGLVYLVKESMAPAIYDNMVSVCALADVPISSIGMFVFTGRLFNSGGSMEEEGTFSPSIADFIMKKLTNSPFKVIDGLGNINGLKAILEDVE